MFNFMFCFEILNGIFEFDFSFFLFCLIQTKVKSRKTKTKPSGGDRGIFGLQMKKKKREIEIFLCT